MCISYRKHVPKTHLIDHHWFGGNAVYLSKIEAGLLSDICRQTVMQYRTDAKDSLQYSGRKTSLTYSYRMKVDS
jgi:hypothetical protein